LPPITREELGRLLFWDPILSGGKDVACATCHHPDLAYADGRPLSLGAGAVGLGPARRDASGGRIPVVKRNSPTVLNVAFNGHDEDGRRGSFQVVTAASVNQARAPMFWDRRIRSLEAQALEPLKAMEEMRGTAYPEAVAVDSVMARLRAIPEYVTLFKEAFGAGTTIGPQQYGQAIAAFQRSLVAINSPFDKYRAGDLTALTPQQARGLEAFDDAGCDRCHEGVMLSDYEVHASAIPFPDTIAPERRAHRALHAQRNARDPPGGAPLLRRGSFQKPQRGRSRRQG
jgi:cytochrome c peroxidase